MADLVQKEEGAQENSTSKNNTPQKKYDVFVSFSGEIRRGFLSHLRNAFQSQQINAFVDDRLKKGKIIWSSLVEAIEGSFMWLIIFSPKYATSPWCLNELVRILECKEKYDHRTVIPVFYNVEPTNVRHQSGCYRKAFAKHKRKPEVQTWRDALTQSADVSGFELKYQTDAELLKEIVKRVQDELKELDKQLLDCKSKGLVGNDKKIAYLESLIRKESESTRVIGIWGMAGIGKTTLVEEVFNRLSSEYDGDYFLENEGQKFNKCLGTIFSKLLRYDVKIYTPNPLPDHIKRKICQMKVLIVLDDVNDSELLEKLLGALYNFKLGSRVIVTTRNKHVLNKADEVYPLEEFSFEEALELFKLNAFKHGDRHQSEYDELSRWIVRHAKRLPLVLTVLARRLCGKTIEVWESELDKLTKMPPAEVYDVMKLSYDDLEREEQEIFLDLACFFLRLSPGKVKVGYLKSLLKDEERDISMVVRLERLKDRALITFSEDNFISMHDSLQEIGREIVRRESNKDPGSRRWLWDPNDIYEALGNNKGTKDIRSIRVDLKIIKEQKLGPGIFNKMSGVKFIEIDNGSYQHNILVEGLQLRYLSWPSYPLTSWSDKFSEEKLVILKLKRGKMEKLWDGAKNLVNLKEVDLSQSKMLKELPDLSKATNLEVLLLWGCSMLTSVHPSIFSLDKLEKLNLSNCKSLTKFASDSYLRGLNYLNLDKCRNLGEFSIISKNMKELGLRHTKVKELPSSFEQQSQLKLLHLTGTYIERLPSSLNNLTQLLNLELINCRKLQVIAELPSFLETLDVKCCMSLMTIPKLPLSIETLNVRNCESLQSLPEFPSSLKTLNAISCCSLQNLPELPPSLKTLDVHNCTSLKTLPQLPQSLESLDVHRCRSLQTLPKLPPSLKTLDVHWCSKLQNLTEYPESSRTLDVSLCSLLQILPDLSKHLETLDVQSCSLLETIPELPTSLKTLNVRKCSSLKTLPQLPQFLETLNVKLCSSLHTLPKLPSSLKTLDARYCNSLQSLPEFPQSLETIDVNGCTLLETLPEHFLFLKTLDATDCISLRTLLLFPWTIEQFRENETRVLFWNCLNLDENSLGAIGLNARINLMRFANHHLSTLNPHHVQNDSDYDVNHNHRSCQAIYVYPGNSVPEWLENKIKDDYIIIDPSLGPSSPLLGFIFCFVLREGEVKRDSVKGRLEVHITIGDGECEGRHQNVRIYIGLEGSEIKSDHVCVVYDQRCSSILTSWAKNQTRFRIAVTTGARDVSLGVIPIKPRGFVSLGRKKRKKRRKEKKEKRQRISLDGKETNEIA